MANGTFYVDNVNGSDANDGLSEANAKATINAGIGLMAGGNNILYVQAAGSNYTLTASAALNVAGTSTDGPNIIEGYTTTPGARDGRPVITSSTNSVDLFNVSAAHWRINHFKFTHTASTRGNGVLGGTTVAVHDCLMDGCASGVRLSDGVGIMYVDRVTAINSTGYGFHGGTHNGIQAYRCAAVGNASGGYGGGIGGNGLGRHYLLCLAANNNGPGFAWTGSGHARTGSFQLCTAADNDSDGFLFDSDATANALYWQFVNNLAYGNGGYGLNISNAFGLTAALLRYATTWGYGNAFGNNTSGARGGLAVAYPGDISLSVSPFVNAGAGNYGLNNDAGGGALLRAAGFPGAFEGTGTTGYLDIGTVQHQDSPAVIVPSGTAAVMTRRRFIPVRKGR